jgi:hypothetical protein
MQYLLRAGDEHPWGTDEGIPQSAVLEFWSEIVPGTDRTALDAELRGIVAPHVPAAIDVRWEQRTRFLPALEAGGEVAIAAALSRALGEEVRYNEVTPEVYRGFGFPGADDLGNMFQFYRDFDEYFLGARDVGFTRSLNPELQSFEQWLQRHKDEIPID